MTARRFAASRPCRPRPLDAPCRRPRSGRAARRAARDRRRRARPACRSRSAARSRSSDARPRAPSARGAVPCARVHVQSAVSSSVSAACQFASCGGASGRTPAERRSSASSGASHVPRWTPFVTNPIRASSSGHSAAHISRATSPWSSETPFAAAERRSASGVRPNPSAPGTRPSASSASFEMPALVARSPT